ncbi:MAG: 50S ribosomal protein L30 [Gammaproteobacteria bacterium]|jgi:large subunit ribosomal protein L30
MAETAKIRITQTRSSHGRLRSHQDTMRGLGLRRIRHTVELDDTPEIRGMINKVAYMVRVED